MNAKPFIKWAGEKGQLLEQQGAYLPEDFVDRRILSLHCNVEQLIELFYYGRDGMNYIINNCKNQKYGKDKS